MVAPSRFAYTRRMRLRMSAWPLVAPLRSRSPHASPRSPRRHRLTDADRAAVIARSMIFHDAAARADEARYFAHFGRKASFLGTDADGAVGRARSARTRTRISRRARRGSMKSVERHVEFDASGRVALVRRAPHHGEARAGARKAACWCGDAEDASGWKIAQYNLSITVPKSASRT